MKRRIAFGALAPSLSSQLALTGEAARHADKDADAITRLAVRGLLTDTETTRARKRLLGALRAALAAGEK